ncbi:MAG: peroxiredoxin [Ignavibacteriaceae bacterium]|nr:peroxiredoxin [Ignavibacteriaceae bacterium]
MKKLVFFLFSFLLVTSFSLAQNTKTEKEGELKVGMSAPNFTLHDAFGHSYKLSSYKGKMPVVVYFYPKAGTSGCTKEACGIRDDWSKFKDSKVQVLGISIDQKDEIKKFVKDYNLNFPLLSDADKNVSKKYGVLSDKGYDNRITFIVDKKGIIAEIINVSDIEGHSAKVLDIASKLN